MKIEHVTLDSSLLIAFFVETEENYLYSKKFMDYAYANDIIFLLPTIVLFEVFHTLKRSGFFKEDHQHEQFQAFLNQKCFKYFNLDIKFFNMFKELPFFDKLKTSDATIAASAFINKSILISWDKKLLKHSWDGYTPEEFLKNFV